MARYPIRIGSKSRLLLRVAFGVTPEHAWVEIVVGEVRVRFGRFACVARVSNIERWRIEGPWRDLVSFFRTVSTVRVKYDMLIDALAARGPSQA